MSESDKKTNQNLIHLDLLSNFYISIDNNDDEHDEDEEDVLEEDEPIINNIGEINTIDFNFKKPVKINKYNEIDDESITCPIHSFAIFARNKKTDEWNLIFYKEDSEYTYPNFENKYKHYKWFIIV